MTMKVLMDTYNYQKDWNAMERTARQALAIDPNDTQAKTYLQSAITKEPVAIVAPLPATASKAPTADDYLNQSLAAYNAQNYDACIAACERALALKPDYAEAYNNLGAAYNQLKQWKKGIAACKKALQLAPGNKLAAGNLAWAEHGLKESSTK